MTFSSEVRYGIRWNCWNTKPTFSARTRFSSEPVRSATFSPSSQISPDDGRSRQPIRLTSVDFPEPEGPIMASHSPDATDNDTLSSALITPPLAPALAGYSLETLTSRIISLSPQNRRGLYPPQQADGQHGREQGHGHAPGKHSRE